MSDEVEKVERTDLVPARNGGRIVKPWDSERARAAVRKRWDRAEAAGRAAMAEAVSAYSKDVSILARSLSLRAPKVQLMAWAEIVGKQAELALATEDRGSTGAARFVGEATGMLRLGRDTRDSASVPDHAPVDARSAALLDLLCAEFPELSARLDAIVAEREGRR